MNQKMETENENKDKQVVIFHDTDSGWIPLKFWFLRNPIPEYPIYIYVLKEDQDKLISDIDSTKNEESESD
jgi:hypothetical protein